jgi:regulator of protease activity HflC (stomatin/prohibitin superfamily)
VVRGRHVKLIHPDIQLSPERGGHIFHREGRSESRAALGLPRASPRAPVLVEIKHVDIDESMVRAIARQAEAERERRAKVINAEGEAQAAEKLLEAARILGQAPEAMQLRYLSTLNVLAGEKSSTIIFPFPIELSEFFARRKVVADN